MQGTLRKLKSTLTSPVEYQLPIGDELVSLNDYIGKPLTPTFTGNIFCCNCGENQEELLTRTLLCMYAQTG